MTDSASAPPSRYAMAATALILTQHLWVWLAFLIADRPLVADTGFWFLPLRRLAMMPFLPAWAAALSFALALAVAWGLAMLSFRRAQRIGRGYLVAALAIVPGVQWLTVLILASIPPRRNMPDPAQPVGGVAIAHVVQGVLAGVGIIVLAVLVSAVGFGAYGWGLFVMTPFLVGITSGYLANRRVRLGFGRTSLVVLAAAALGTFALVMFALEGLVCILLAAPLGVLAALAGGGIGRAIAGHGRGKNAPLMSVALLPALFVLEAAMPPFVPIESRSSIEIEAAPGTVWAALTSNEAIAAGPGIIGATGLAYPLRARLEGSGIGAARLGEFSTGMAVERVTEWSPGQRLAFRVVRQPPAMEEMSPYRRVHSPHVKGYFETGLTRFTLQPIAGGRTRLEVESWHALRVDPALYWEPLARFAIKWNVARVLNDVRARAERSSPG